MKDIPVQCTRCRHVMTHGDLVPQQRRRRSPSDIPLSDLVCPRCGCKSYYDMTPQVAWCWASGLIEIGDAMPANSPDGGGAIEIAHGPKCALKSRLSVLARHGQGASAGQLLVPGVPEAKDADLAFDMLMVWLDWCGTRSNRKGGVTFSSGRKP